MANTKGKQNTTPRRSALILVDVQEDFCEPKGALAVQGGRALAPVWNKLLASGKYDVKVATFDWHPADHISFASQHDGAHAFTSEHTIGNPENSDETFTTILWPDHCIADTNGASLIPEIEQQYLTHRIYKGQDKRLESYSAFGPPFRKPAMSASNLHDVLKQSEVQDIWVIGLAYDYCVKHTALDAAELGYRVTVLEGATKAVNGNTKNLEAVRRELLDAGIAIVQEEV